MTTNQTLRIAVMIGSTRAGRLGPSVANWFAKHAAARPDMTVDLIDLAESALPDTLAAEAPKQVLALGRRLASADAFVVVTPEYNHSFPAPLKAAIDWYSVEWRRKPVAFVSYGGVSGGLRAVEQLRLVFAELEAVTIRPTVSFHGVQAEFDADGNPRDPSRRARSAAALLDDLAWWARALDHARAADTGESRSLATAG